MWREIVCIALPPLTTAMRRVREGRGQSGQHAKHGARAEGLAYCCHLHTASIWCFRSTLVTIAARSRCVCATSASPSAYLSRIAFAKRPYFFKRYFAVHCRAHFLIFALPSEHQAPPWLKLGRHLEQFIADFCDTALFVTLNRCCQKLAYFSASRRAILYLQRASPCYR
jgi:hypothetical protein